MFKGWQSFELRDDATLHVMVKKGLTSNEYDLPVDVLDPDPARHKRIPGGWIVAMVILGSLSGLWWTLFCFNLNDRTEAASLAVAAVIFTALFGASCYGFKINIFRSVIFYNRYSGQIALVLWDKLPTVDVCTAFVRILSEKARAVSPSPTTGGTGGIAEEIRKLKELVDQGALSPQEFEVAKSKLLKRLDEKNSIGFQNA